ncbi:McrC family protein [Myxococcota bacterium]|nr:McrC family protein [Myxococcota bacterium]
MRGGQRRSQAALRGPLSAPPTLRIREWSTITPSEPGGAALRGLRLSVEDRALLANLGIGEGGRPRLKIMELREGLAITTTAYIGAVQLSCLRLIIEPKMTLKRLMSMVAYGFEIDELALSGEADYAPATQGLLDLLGLALLNASLRLTRRGLRPAYRAARADLSTPRGRVDLAYEATHPPRGRLRCDFEDFTLDHPLNQILASGLVEAASVMLDRGLRFELRRLVDRAFGGVSRPPLTASGLRRVAQQLNRQQRDYRLPLQLIRLIHEGRHLGDDGMGGALPLWSFMLNMNRLFERFLERHLRRAAPPGVRVEAQATAPDRFRYEENPKLRPAPQIRPDFVLWQGDEVYAVADAKYKRYDQQPPSTADLYQLTIYGLAYGLRAPKAVLLLYPLPEGQAEAREALRFEAPGLEGAARVRLVGVPVDQILDGATGWWFN